MLWTGLQLQEISTTNKLPQLFNTAVAMQKKAAKVASLDHDRIMEEAGRCNRLEYNSEEESNNADDQSYFESASDSESKM